MVIFAAIGAGLLLAWMRFALRKRAVTRRSLLVPAPSRQCSKAAEAAQPPAEDLEGAAGSQTGAEPGSREQWLEQEVASLRERLDAIFAVVSK